MALTDDYEPVRASLLHLNPLPSLEDALPRLKSEENRLGLTHAKSDNVFAATDKKALGAPDLCLSYSPTASRSEQVSLTSQLLAAATESTDPSSLNPPSVSPFDIESLLKQLLYFLVISLLLFLLLQDRWTGRVIGTGCKVGRLFELENLHIPSTTIFVMFPLLLLFTYGIAVLPTAP
ncbi:hypothetical protein PIB30_001527 [Stylosanthes scabra]|uniref:Uncharacterized protein n=1 Tax=Stylosanthes scabra TaxID=79078 RepID=A0ABU6R2M1_9FABA|nr:hypothetical protein [Stylosanthes scabra]